MFFCEVTVHKAYQLKVTQNHIHIKMSYVLISGRITFPTSNMEIVLAGFPSLFKYKYWKTSI